MITELIFTIILFSSFGTILAIFIRKMPALCEITEPVSGSREFLIAGIKNSLKKMPGIPNFSYDLYLQKTLSKFRVLSMKTESKTGSWLEKLRQKKSQKDGEETVSNGYWDKLKKAKDDR